MNRKLPTVLLVLISVFCYHSLLAGPGPSLGTLTGTVIDKADGKAVIGATIWIPDMKTGTTTDATGKFSITLSTKGIHLVQISYVGYATFDQNVYFTVTSHLEVQLALSTIEAGEVVVTGVSKATEMKRAPIPIVAVGKSYMDQHS